MRFWLKLKLIPQQVRNIEHFDTQTGKWSQSKLKRGQLPVNVQLWCSQIRYVRVCVVAIPFVRVHRNAGQAISIGHNRRGNFKATNKRITIQVVDPNRWTLHVRSIVWVKRKKNGAKTCAYCPSKHRAATLILTWVFQYAWIFGSRESKESQISQLHSLSVNSTFCFSSYVWYTLPVSMNQSRSQSSTRVR